MKLSDFKNQLLAATQHELRFELPGGDLIPVEAHVTEVGRIDKNFVDCGGAVHTSSTCHLQVWVAENDEAHRLPPGKLAGVIESAAQFFRGDDLNMEVEYEECGIISQFPVVESRLEKDSLTFVLGQKHTDCLAKEVCGLTPAKPAGCCCGGKC